MKILPVHKYHRKVADRKYYGQKGHNPKSMYYFILEDSKGYPTEERKYGYIAFDDTKAVFGLNQEKAIKKFYCS